MVTRESKTVLHVSDVMPVRLTTKNRDPLVDRLKSYRRMHHYDGVNQDVLDHFESLVGSYTILVADLESSGSDNGTRRAWSAIEAWAEDWNVTII